MLPGVITPGEREIASAKQVPKYGPPSPPRRLASLTAQPRLRAARAGAEKELEPTGGLHPYLTSGDKTPLVTSPTTIMLSKETARVASFPAVPLPAFGRLPEHAMRCGVDVVWRPSTLCTRRGRGRALAGRIRCCGASGGVFTGYVYGAAWQAGSMFQLRRTPLSSPTQHTTHTHTLAGKHACVVKLVRCGQS